MISRINRRALAMAEVHRALVRMAKGPGTVSAVRNSGWLLSVCLPDDFSFGRHGGRGLVDYR